MSNLQQLTEDSIKILIDGKANYEPFREIAGSNPQNYENSRCAAVLCPLVRQIDGWHLVFIRRTETVFDHKGQVAFPGGVCEPEDQSLEETALRETTEEIGVAAKDIRILGRLRGLETVSSYRITPVVGAFDWPYQFTPSVEEVSRIFTIPLEWLINPENQEARAHARPGVEIPVIYFKPFDGELLWGATARIVNNLLEILELRQK